MDIIAVMNLKGGVAKTTVTALLAEKLARDGRRVLAIDTDPQCDLSTRFLNMKALLDYHGYQPPPHPDFDSNNPIWKTFATPPPGYWSVAQLLGSGYAEPYTTKTKNLSVLPAHTQDLTLLLRQIGEAKIEDQVVPYLAELLNAEYFSDHYDVIVIDTPPQNSSINQAVLRAATHLVIPTELADDSLNAVSSMLALWNSEKTVRGANNPLTLAGIIPTRYNPRSRPEQNLLEGLQQDTIIKPYLTPPMRAMITYQSDSGVEKTKSVLDLHERNLCRADACRWLNAILKTTQEKP